MQFLVKKSAVQGTLDAPSSKSCSQRAFAAALLRNGRSIISHVGNSVDEQTALSIIKKLGATVSGISEEQIVIDSKGPQFNQSHIYMGESGLCARLFGSILAMSPQPITMGGSGSLLKRTMKSFEEFLPPLGVDVKTSKGYLPITLKGPLMVKDTVMDGAISSQYVSGLLFAFSFLNARGVLVGIKNFVSKPYIDLTLDVMKSFGMSIPQKLNNNQFYFPDVVTANPLLDVIRYDVEGDWSNSAFLLVVAAINGNLSVRRLKTDSKQADKRILSLLQSAHIECNAERDLVTVHQSVVHPFHFDATDSPDLFPPAVVLASFSNGLSSIKGVSRLMNKESNRAESLQEEFSKFNVQMYTKGDTMFIQGGNLRPAYVNSHNDHRIAMACCAVAVGIEGTSQIDGVECIHKSYPNFYEDLRRIGVDILTFT